MYFKIYQPITIVALDGKRRDSLSDMTVIITNPNGVDIPIITMSSAGNGYYYTQFTPTLCGRWLVRIVCNSYPKNNSIKDYLVTQEIVSYLQGEKYTYVAKALASPFSANKIHSNLWNVSSSIIKIYRIVLSVRMDANITGLKSSFDGIRTSTAGTGIFINITGLDTMAPNLTGISFINSLTVNPTVVTNGELFSLTIDPEETRSDSGHVIAFESSNGISPIFIRPNEGLCIKQNAVGTAGKVNIYYYFTID